MHLLRMLVLIAAQLVAAQGWAQSQTLVYPNRPIRVVVAWPAGGGVDTPTRLIAPVMGRLLGQPLVLDNRGGASGTIGEAEAARANTAFFEQLGFELEDYGNNDIAVRQVPYAADGGAIRDMVCEIAAMLSKGHPDGASRTERAVYTIACKGAVKANRNLSELEIKSLLKEVAGLDGVNTCPHGRPFTIKLSKQEIEKLFKRIVN